MREHVPVISRLCFAATLACTLIAATLDDDIQAELERPQLVLDSTRTTSLAGFTLLYDVRFTNRSENSADFPDRDMGSDRASWITLLSVQSQQANGSWNFVVNPGTLT